MPGLLSTARAEVAVVDSSKHSAYGGGNRSLSFPRAVIASAWRIENSAEEAGLNRWRITSLATNISGTTLYDCTAKLSLDGSGTIFPEARQRLGDFAPGDSFVVTWTVEVGKDTRGYVVLWCGSPERDPSKREPGGCN